jgi:hypothetical protein
LCQTSLPLARLACQLHSCIGTHQAVATQEDTSATTSDRALAQLLPRASERQHLQQDIMNSRVAMRSRWGYTAQRVVAPVEGPGTTPSNRLGFSNSRSNSSSFSAHCTIGWAVSRSTSSLFHALLFAGPNQYLATHHLVGIPLTCDADEI